jgi:glycerophosphoryl diester phosphodiesterase
MLSLRRRDGRPLVIGHRGAAALVPENTLASFRAALELGVDLIEFDVLELEAGDLVLAHSDDLREVSHGAAAGSVRDRTLASLREVAADLPTLDEALEYFRTDATEVGVHADLKSPSSVDEVVAAVRRFGLVERTFVSSFHASALRRLRQLEPLIATGVAFPNDRLEISRRRGSRPFVAVGLRGLRPLTPAFAARLLARSGASALVLQHTLVTPGTVRRSHARGAAVVAWTIEREQEFARVDAAGADAIVVDNPALFVSTLQT